MESSPAQKHKPRSCPTGSAGISGPDMCPDCARLCDEVHTCPVPRSPERFLWQARDPLCLRKVNGKLESQTFIHIFQSGLQDSTAVVLIMDHVQHPEIVSSFFRQDNAGCYHSAGIILSVDILSKRSDIQINPISFSESALP